MLISFKDLNNLLLKYVCTSWNKGDYLVNLADLIMCEPIDEEEEQERIKGEYNPFTDKTHDMLRKITRGVVPVSESDARKVYTHFDADKFIDKVNSLLDNARDRLIGELMDYGVNATAFTVGEEIAAILEEHFKQFAKMDQKQGWQATNNIDAPVGEMAVADIKELQIDNTSTQLFPDKGINMCRVSITAELTEETKHFKDFSAFYNHLRFLGRTATLPILELVVRTEEGEVVYEYRSQVDNKECISLPDTFMRFPTSPFNMTDDFVGTVTIEPEFLYRRLELLDEKDRIIVPTRKYKIERSQDGGITTTTFVDQDGAPYTSVNYYIRYDEKAKKIVDAGVKIHRVSNTLSACVEYYGIEERMASSRTALCREVDHQLDLFKVGVSTKSGSMRKAKNEAKRYKELFQKMIYLEAYFHVKFQFPEVVTPFEAKSVFMLYDLVRNGVAESPLYRLNLDDPLDIDDPNKTGVIFSNLSESEIMGAKFDYSGKQYVIINFIEEIKQNEDGYYVDIKKSYVYDEARATLTQEEIVGNLLKGSLVIN